MPTKSKFLLLADLGNTSVSAALADVSTCSFHRRVRIAAASGRVAIKKALDDLCAPLDAPPVAAVLSSVKPSTGALWAAELKRASGKAPLVVNSSLRFDFSFASYPNPKTIGPDRLADACAALWLCGASVICINCGTATVLNVVNSRRVFAGGMILPGAPLFLEYLSDQTALLPKLSWQPVPRRIAGLARDTQTAMRLGAKIGFESIVRSAIAHARLALANPDAPAIITGGYAGRLTGLKLDNIKHEPDLTLIGLWRIHALNAKSASKNEKCKLYKKQRVM